MKRFKLAIENGRVTIPSANDPKFHVAIRQLMSLLKAGCRIEEVFIMRSEPHENQ